MQLSDNAVSVRRKQWRRIRRAQWHCSNDVTSRKEKQREKKGVNEGLREKERQIKIEGEVRESRRASGNVLMM